MSRAVPVVLLAGYALCLSFILPEWAGSSVVPVVAPAGGGGGVSYRRETFRGSPVDVLDVDLDTPGVSVRVHGQQVVRGGGAWRVGDAFTLPVWCRLTGAVGGINGGFFGLEVAPGRKEVIGLLQLQGRVVAPAAHYRSRPDRVRYAHSALGVDARGNPRIDWVVGARDESAGLLCFDRPERLEEGRPWPCRDAVAGGPRLIQTGRVAVAARAERLASPGKRPRSLVGYTLARGRRHLVLAAAAAFTYEDAAAFLAGYFRRQHGLPCGEAMCLDGGTSSQLAFRQGRRYRAPFPSTVSVPTCVLVHYRRQVTRQE
jgi:hypothetical protein